MKIKKLQLNNFMLFEDLSIAWSPHINVICGENSTGKTTLLKAMYSLAKPLGKKDTQSLTKEQTEDLLVSKLLGVFRPDEMKLGRLATRKQGGNKSEIILNMEKNRAIELSFSNRQGRHADVTVTDTSQNKDGEAVYLPPKEMISATEHFQSLYEDYHLDFEETYYDLAKLLDKPLRKGPNTAKQNEVLTSIQDIIKGSVIQKDKKFYLDVQGSGKFEMGLVSEGYRKLATIVYLILSGSLGKDSVLFWDEPETNMNPKMIQPITETLVKLAQMGVQVFITTHDYFLLQSFNLFAAYPQTAADKTKIQFVSLYETDDGVKCETAADLSGLKHNAIMEEFDAVYDREQNAIYGQ